MVTLLIFLFLFCCIEKHVGNNIHVAAFLKFGDPHISLANLRLNSVDSYNIFAHRDAVQISGLVEALTLYLTRI